MKPRRTVYFLRAGSCGPVKIGSAANVVSRVRSIQTGCPFPLRILATLIDENGKTEQSLHYRFREFRTSGEWFKPDRTILAFVRSHATEWKAEQPVQHLRGRPRKGTERLGERVLCRMNGTTKTALEVYSRRTGSAVPETLRALATEKLRAEGLL